MTLDFRTESPADASAIEALTTAAFLHAPHTSHTEQFIVGALRQADQLTLSLLAEQAGAIVGHVAISPVTISRHGDHDNTGIGWYGLGPISVAPDCRRQGIGKPAKSWLNLTAQATSARWLRRIISFDRCLISQSNPHDPA